MRWIAELIGVALVLLALADVFLTVLYVRSGTAILSDRAARLTWRLFRWLGETFPRHRGKVLTFGGALILIGIIAMWVMLMMLGFSLIVWPNLGSSITTMQVGSTTPTGFSAALAFAAGQLSTAGSGDLVPGTPAMRIITGVFPLIGISVLTLTLTYVLEVYNALMRRNVFALRLHFATACTGDAAELIAGLGATGDFSGARADLGALGADLVNLYESHHFYSTMLYFRWRQPEYALSRVATVCMDTATLVRTALEPEQYAALQDCAASTTLWHGGTHLMREMARVLLPGACGEPGEAPDAPTERRWRAHYSAALTRLRKAGIRTVQDERRGADDYVEMRQQWDAAVSSFAEYMEYAPAEMDPPVSGPKPRRDVRAGAGDHDDEDAPMPTGA